MNQKTIEGTTMTNSLKWLIAATLLLCGLLGNIKFAEQSLLFRLPLSLLVIGLAMFVAVQTEKGKTFWNFILESRTEMRKVVWPTRQETVQTTGLVLLMVFVMGLILWGVDTVLLKAVGWITGYGAIS